MAAAAIALATSLAHGAPGAPLRESYVHVPMPPHFRVEATELDGPVFADPRGHTLYTWPFKVMRVGNTGDPKGQSHCTSTKSTVSAGYMSPYPPGLELPELDTRPSCTQVWLPVPVAPGSKPVSKWTIITRDDGRKQWAYDGLPVYTSVRDRQPGDVLGAENYEHEGDAPAVRRPIGPPPDLPPGFLVSSTWWVVCCRPSADFPSMPRTRTPRANPSATPRAPRPGCRWSPRVGASARGLDDHRARTGRSPMGVSRQAAVPLCAGFAGPEPGGERRTGLAQRLHAAHAGPAG